MNEQETEDTVILPFGLFTDICLRYAEMLWALDGMGETIYQINKRTIDDARMTRSKVLEWMDKNWGVDIDEEQETN
jgi:hypothetical protein